MIWDHFLEICRRLNAAGVEYVLVGGFAVILHGFERTTRYIDFLINTDPANVQKIKTALADLMPDAAAEITLDDVAQYTVCA